jgi:hypothetical protein
MINLNNYVIMTSFIERYHLVLNFISSEKDKIETHVTNLIYRKLIFLYSHI